MARLDLDAKRAARSEAENKPHEVILGGRTYLLRPTMPLEFTDLLNTPGRAGEAMRLILVDPSEWEEMRKAIPDDEDLVAITELYGVELPESAASAPSSSNGGTSSRRTSKRRTGSTSHKPAGAAEPSASGAWPSSSGDSPANR